MCNYGGVQLTSNYAEKHLLPFEDKCDYVLELREMTGNGTYISNANNFLLVFAVSGPFTSFLVLHTISWFSRSEVCAFVLGNICERFARRDLC